MTTNLAATAAWSHMSVGWGLEEFDDLLLSPLLYSLCSKCETVMCSDLMWGRFEFQALVYRKKKKDSIVMWEWLPTPPPPPLPPTNCLYPPSWKIAPRVSYSKYSNHLEITKPYSGVLSVVNTCCNSTYLPVSSTFGNVFGDSFSHVTELINYSLFLWTWPPFYFCPLFFPVAYSVTVAWEHETDWEICI